jgi:hypothetical protein
MRLSLATVVCSKCGRKVLLVVIEIRMESSYFIMAFILMFPLFRYSVIIVYYLIINTLTNRDSQYMNILIMDSCYYGLTFNQIFRNHVRSYKCCFSHSRVAVAKLANI